MSSMTPHKGQRRPQNSAAEFATASPRNPQSPHDLNIQAYSQNVQSAMAYSDQPTTPPRTPRRVQQNQPASQSKPNSAIPDHSSRKSTNKRRPKNTQTSPAATRNNRTTPPLTGTQSASSSNASRPIQTPSSAVQAYAGPTFHASPAPSALPMPSFYSKSVPESPAINSGSAIKEADSSADESSQTPSSAQVFSDVSHREESPLDLFFKADKRERAEKIRARSTNSNSTGSVGPFNPPLASPGNTRTPPQPDSQHRNKNIPKSRGSASGVFSMELDGSNSAGLPLGPAFSTPYNERIKAARKTSSPSQPHNLSPSNSLSNPEALKAYLFSTEPSINGNLGPALSSATNSAMSYQGGHSSPSGPRSAGMPGVSPQTNYKYRGDSRSTSDIPKSARSGLRQEVTPSKTPTRTPDRANSYGPSQIHGNNSSTANDGNSGTQVTHSSPVPQVSSGILPANSNPDLRGMENDLRRILKLESPSFAGPAM